MKELVQKDEKHEKPKEKQWSVFDFKQLEYFKEKTKKMLEKRFGPVNLDLLDAASRELNWLIWEYAEARKLLYQTDKENKDYHPDTEGSTKPAFKFA